ncbi:MAG TPA: UrcA family protein [Lysobacter sp.]|nr:UrcA family protein [Lysobacter sp.]
MANRNVATGTIPMVLLIALSTGSPAIAQTSTEPKQLETITVVAPRITYQVKRERGSLAPTEVTVAEKSAKVNLGDLDLTRTADLYVLEDRIGKAAAQVCEELAQQFPEGEPSVAVCTRRATDDAMSQLRQVTRQAALTSKP